MPTKAEKLAKIDEQIAKLKVKENEIKAADRKAERKRDTRRKTILGAHLIYMAKRDAAYGRVIKKLIETMGERDAAVFENWESPAVDQTVKTTVPADHAGTRIEAPSPAAHP